MRLIEKSKKRHLFGDSCKNFIFKQGLFTGVILVLMVLIDRYFDSTQEIYPGLGLAVMFGIASYFIMPKLISHFDVCMKNERYFQVVGYLNSFLITFFIYHNRTEILSDCAPFPGGPALAGVLMVGIFFEVVLVFFVTDRVTKFLV